MTARREKLLPARLRAYAMLKDSDGVLAASGVSAALREAADEIEQLRAQIDGSAGVS